MPTKNINNYLSIVIFLALLLASLPGCERPSRSRVQPPEAGRSAYSAPVKAGRIESGEITESSGIAASKCQDDVLWTHNDSGDGPFVFALDKKGRHLGTWKVLNAQHVDWEDMASHKDASGKCFLYIGEIGNNPLDGRSLAVYRVAEPAVTDVHARTTRQDPASTEPAESMVFRYPDRPHNAETLMVHPETELIYVLTKDRKRPASIFRILPRFGEENVFVAEKVGEISVPAVPNGFLTGGDIAPDGRRAIICDYFAAYEFELPKESSNFDDIWAQEASVVELGERKQGEAITYSANGRSLFATSEGKDQPLLRVDRNDR